MTKPEALPLRYSGFHDAVLAALTLALFALVPLVLVAPDLVALAALAVQPRSWLGLLRHRKRCRPAGAALMMMCCRPAGEPVLTMKTQRPPLPRVDGTENDNAVRFTVWRGRRGVENALIATVPMGRQMMRLMLYVATDGAALTIMVMERPRPAAEGPDDNDADAVPPRLGWHGR